MPEPFSIIALVSALAPIANKGISKILQSETVQNLGGSFLGGPVEEVSGSLAQTGFNKLVSSLPTILSSPQNHDILRAVRRSYLNATLTMCFARLKILNPSKAEWKNLLSQTIPQNEKPSKVIEALRKGLQTNDADTNKEIEWLFRAIKELNQSLSEIADWKTSEVIEQATKASELLLKPANAKNQIDQLIADLKSEVIEELARTASFQIFLTQESVGKEHYAECLPPALLENLEKGWFELEDDGSILHQSSEKVDFEWFNVMCVFFAEEIKTNTRVSDIFNARMLADLKYQNGQPCNFTAEMFAEKLAESNKILLERLTNIEKEVSGLDEFKDEVRGNFSQLIPLIVTVNDIADVVRSLLEKVFEITQTTRRTDETTQRTEAIVVEIGKNVTEIQNQLSKDSFNRFGKASAVSEYEFEKCKKLKWLRKEVSMSESYQLLPMLRTVRTEDLPKEQTTREDFSNFDYREYEVRKWQEKLNDKYKTYQTSHSIDAIFSDFENIIRNYSDERSREKIIVGKTPRLVVLGEPGSGKSTLCKFLAFSCQYQKFATLSSQSGFHWQLVSSEGDFLTPVRIKLSDWETWAIHKRDFSLENYLINLLYECVKDIPTKEQWRSLFEKGEILLLLDGLDEIGNNATFKEKVTDTLQRTNYCPTIVTCRTVSFETHQDILSEFPIFSLDGLNKSQQDALIYEYEKDGTLVAGELRKQLDSSYEIASLASNPLLLTIICFVVSNSNTNQEVRLPEKKSQLYDKAIDRLLNAWQDRDNPTNELEIEEKKEILAELAYWLWTENEDRKMGFSGKSIKEKISEILKSKGFQNSRELAHSLLKDFSKQGGILIGESNNNYGFLHLTFYEYLVAFALANHEDCLEIALSKTFKSEWEKILVFFGGTLSKKNKTKTNDFFLKLVSLFWDSFATTEKEDEDEEQKGYSEDDEQTGYSEDDEQTDYSEVDVFSPDDSLLRLLYVTIGFGIESEIGEVEQVAMDVWALLGDTFLIDEYLFEFFEFQKRENNHESTELFFDYEKEVKLLRISQSFLIPIIIQIIEDSQKHNEIRRHAVLMLSVMPIENATLALEKLIQNNNLHYELREDALWVLTNVFFADAIKVLKRIKSNPEISKWVRDECVKFVLRISKENKPLFLYTDEDERIY